MQQQQLTDLLRFIKNTDSDQSDLAATVLKLAADSITLDTLRSLTGSDKSLFPYQAKRKYRKKKRPAHYLSPKGVGIYAEIFSKSIHL